MINLVGYMVIYLPVSYTHLDVYKRQLQTFGGKAKTTEYIKNVFIGIFIMSFAYGLIKILAFTFLE